MKIEIITKADTGANDPTVAVKMLVPITKVDEENRIIEGVATGEWLDAHGEIVDYETAKAAFGAWPGNIREMHQPIAAGRAVGIACDDTAKAITVRSYISEGAEPTWLKIKDGTLRCYSIGAEGTRALEKRGDVLAPVIYLTKMGELSVVDEGALPGSEIAIVKMIDGALQTTEAVAVPPTEQPSELAAAGVTSLQVVDKDGTPLGETVAIDRSADAQSAIMQVDGIRSILATVAKAAGVSSRAALLTTAQAAIDKLADPQKATVRKFVESYDIFGALNAIAALQDLVASEYYDLAYPADSEDVATERAQLETLRAAMGLVMAFLQSEFDEQFAAVDQTAPDMVAMAKAVLGSAAVQKALADLPATFSALDGSGKVVFIGKAGARHSKADVTMIQNMHDTAIGLGAMCGSAEKRALAPATAPVDKAAPVIASATSSLDQAAVQKMIDSALGGMVQKVTDLESTIATQRATIEKQAADLEHLKAQPAPGGPVTRALAPGSVVVDKAMGHSGQPAGDVTPDALRAAVEELSKQAKSEADRQFCAEAMIKLQHSTGMGVASYRFGAPTSA